jgi:hypothetical protein
MEGTPSEGVAAKPINAMTLSTEAIVAAAVAVVFAILTLAAIVREQDAPGNGLPNVHGLNQMATVGFETSASRPLLDETGDNQLLAQR